MFNPTNSGDIHRIFFLETTSLKGFMFLEKKGKIFSTNLLSYLVVSLTNEITSSGT